MTSDELVEFKQNGIEFPFDVCVSVFSVCQGFRFLSDGFPHSKAAPTLYFDASPGVRVLCRVKITLNRTWFLSE